MTSTLLAGLPESELNRRLAGEGLSLRISPFVFRIKSRIAVVRQGLRELYADYEVVPSEAGFADFHVAVVQTRWLVRPLCMFEVDGLRPFTPLALGEAFAFLEWGMNWCVTGYCHNFITIHSAVLERAGRVLILPGAPGAGKSTLCAALVLNGWRLLSDEMALLDLQSGMVVPSPRPVGLKNQSIEIIGQLASGLAFGPVARDTMKGTVAHLRPPRESVARASEAALPGWVIFPRYVQDAPALLVARGKAASLMELAQNSFNQSVHGRAGFEALSDLIDRCDCHDFTYGRLDEALAVFAGLEALP